MRVMRRRGRPCRPPPSAAQSLSARHVVQTVRDPRGVVVHVFVAGLQLFAPQSIASVATVQARHVPLTQRGAPAT